MTKGIALMEAISKMTLLPAQVLEDQVPQMKKRGRIQGAALALGLSLGAAGPAVAQTGNDDSAFNGPETVSLDASVERDALFEPEGWSSFYGGFDAARGNLYKNSGLKLGFYHSTLYQNADASLPGQDSSAIATITGLYGTWDLVERGNAAAGQLSFGVEGRWGYGDRLTPSELGTIGIGSATGTADPYGATDPNVVLRELFWRGGSAEQGWDYRIGKITTDRLLTGSDFIDPVSLGLPVGSQGSPSVGWPDSGLGFAAGFYPTDRFRFGVVVSDANGDRTDWGDIGEGNFFKAIELQGRLLPLTDKAPFSSVTLWHTDGTDDPDKANDSSTGESGWGYFVKLEQELSGSGQDIAMIRYGRSPDGAAAYKEQGSIRYVRIDPPDPFNVKDDAFGIAASFVRPEVNPFDRKEWGIDMFYRFSPLKRLETSIGYQYIRNPTYNPGEDAVNVFSVRLTQFF